VLVAVWFPAQGVYQMFPWLGNCNTEAKVHDGLHKSKIIIIIIIITFRNTQEMNEFFSIYLIQPH
jgi:hypothetical protein